MANDETSIVRTEGFSAIEVKRNAELAATAMAAKAKASIEAACIMAERHPRDLLQVRAQLLKECERSRFAEKARYKLPRNSYNRETNQYEKTWIYGFSIRFAESALMHMGNMSASSEVVYEDDEKLTLTITVRDYERNSFVEDAIVVTKLTEKRFLRRGDSPVATRTNSNGETVFILKSTLDEVTQRRNAAVSKSMRTLILRLIPADLKEECEDQCVETVAQSFKSDPTKEIKRVVDAFAKIRVMPAQLAEYLGHTVDTVDVNELNTLRGIYQAIADNDTTWAEVIEAQREEREPTSDGEIVTGPRQAAVADALAKASAKVAAKAAEKAKPRQKPEQAPPQAPTEPDRWDNPDA